MLNFLRGRNNNDRIAYDTTSDGLRELYNKKILPLEREYLFHDFHAPILDRADFETRPMVLLVGQYSTGKTSFIRYLLEQDFPGMHIGEEPTTDGFTVVMKGETDALIPGNALAVDPNKPFRVLSKFGTAFLNKFQCATVNNPVLDSISLVDTPGILAGAKQNSRGYDFTAVFQWFSQRVDRIIILFDAHKLDISDEFRRALESLRGNEDKIRIVLNKSDSFSPQQLMRVYGALLWSISKVFQTPEVIRVIVGSFWNKPMQRDDNRQLFEAERETLFTDLQQLPRSAALRQLNDMIKRARLAKVHAAIVSAIKDKWGAFAGEKKKKEIIRSLDKIYETISMKNHIPLGDFPDVDIMREKLAAHEFKRFPQMKPKLIESVNIALKDDVAPLMKRIDEEDFQANSASQLVRGGAFGTLDETPFSEGYGEGVNMGEGEQFWIIAEEKANRWDKEFEALGPINGLISGRVARNHMVKSRLPNSTLGNIWKLADIGKDGSLDDNEFAIAMHLIQLKLQGHEIPSKLPQHLYPPKLYPDLN